ncbi:MAG: hypothetical protein OXH65_03595 [Paracoccaceae bacterium]|nr:hypothetical protein [Paracoccaceae bacterium]MDE2674170.1 hypothetical protein [Paracoccaceae bacterium]
MKQNKTAWQKYMRANNHMQWDLTDMEWAVIEPLLIRQERMGRTHPRTDNETEQGA